ncbi:MAG: hypothetical protein K8T26_10925 [Lentisphaerae bacterium]|nr:hypothetical protein [Lentisphaerota bacterium]
MSSDSLIKARIYGVLSAGSYQMHKLLCLLDIELSERIDTAAVDVAERPRMLLNPHFVEQYCRRDEHLFLLVLHELYHVILGHTRLFPKLTVAHNIAFDAVINAMLCRQFPGQEFDGFLETQNAWDDFPSRLLRPPPSWRAANGQIIEKDFEGIPDNQQAVLRRLYGNEGNSVTYLEIFELLVSTLGNNGKGKGYILLGDHDPAGKEQAVLANAEVFGIVRRVVEGWPPPPFHIAGRDEGRSAQFYQLTAAERARKEFRIALEAFLRKAGVLGDGRANRRLKIVTDQIEMESVLPEWRDRRVPALTAAWGARPLLYRTTTPSRRPRREPVPVAHVYLDISGSMSAVLPVIAAALRKPHLEGACKVFVFSTVIDEVPPGRLLRAKVRNTFGTDINCVLKHVLDIPQRRRPRRIALVTDGYVGQADAAQVARLKAENIRVHVALAGSDWEKDFKPYAHAIVKLPAGN